MPPTDLLQDFLARRAVLAHRARLQKGLAGFADADNPFAQRAREPGVPPDQQEIAIDAAITAHREHPSSDNLRAAIVAVARLAPDVLDDLECLVRITKNHMAVRCDHLTTQHDLLAALCANEQMLARERTTLNGKAWRQRQGKT